ncbi:MAG: hypothetical protein ACW98J_09250 [Candidatus Thorarchaeota archaeon]|jgi:hypothetical protein
MIESKTTSIRRDSVVDLVDLVERNVSSIDMLSSQLGISPEETQKLLLDLVREGRLAGKLTTDGARFFRSDVKTSDAQTIASAPELEFEKQDAKPGIFIMLSGIVLFIIGNLLVNTSVEFGTLWGVGSALLLGGPLVLIAGLFYVSKMNPPQKLR